MARADEVDGDFRREGWLKRYVAIGTSISMGVNGLGVSGSTQEHSWTVQLADMAGNPFTQPLIAEPGCGAPLMSPLASGRRVNGEPVVGNTICAPLIDGVTLPANDVAIDGSTTHEALAVTPETADEPAYPGASRDPFRAALFSRVLPPGMTQVTAMLAQKPKFVSVELGGNEVLKSRNGVLVPGVTLVTYEMWQPEYDQIIDAIASMNHTRAVLVGLVNDVRTFPSFRRGAELWADRAEFAALYINVSPDCGTVNSENVMFVYARILPLAGAARQAAANHQPMPTLTCADFPGQADYVLNPADIAVLNAQMARMNAHIRELAERNGYAYFELESLYGRTDLKPAFSAVGLLTSSSPFGAYISIDGIHPNTAGHGILATAAAEAINATYGTGIPVSAAATLVAAR
jgi:lysophospholipase L1-like esterase